MINFLKNSVKAVKERISEKIPKKSFPIKRMANLFGGALLAVSAYTGTAEAQESHVQMSTPVANHVFYHNNTPGVTDGNEALLAVHRVQTGGLAIDTRQMNNAGSKNGFIRRDVHTLQESGRLVAFIRDQAGNEWQLPVNESGLAYMPPSHPALANTLSENGVIQAQDIMVGTLENGTAHIIATAFQGTRTTSIPSIEQTHEKAVQAVSTDIQPQDIDEAKNIETPVQASAVVEETPSVTKEPPTVAPLATQAPPAALASTSDRNTKEEAPERPWLPFGAGAMVTAVGAYMYKRYKKVTKAIDTVSNVPALLPYAPQEVAEEQRQEVSEAIKIPTRPQSTATAEEIMDLQELYEERKDPRVGLKLLKALSTRFGLENIHSMDIAETIIGFRGYTKIDSSSMYYGRLLMTLDLASPKHREKKNEVFWLHSSAVEALKVRAEWNRTAQSKLIQKLWSLSETNTLPVLQRSKLEELIALRNESPLRQIAFAA